MKYERDTKCSVQNCIDPAEYEVVLYDYYVHSSETFYEQDYTCPFLCKKHMDENEAQAIGERIPRNGVVYPYTNKYVAQGYSKYNPIKEVYPQFFDSGDIENKEQLQIDLNEINDELIKYLGKHPQFNA